jgi:hypothetical protein
MIRAQLAGGDVPRVPTVIHEPMLARLTVRLRLIRATDLTGLRPLLNFQPSLTVDLLRSGAFGFARSSNRAPRM